MKPRGHRLRPPTSTAFKFGQVIVLDAEDDEIQLDLPAEESGLKANSSNAPPADFPMDTTEASEPFEDAQS